MNTIQKPPTRFLTHDEIVTFPDGGYGVMKGHAVVERSVRLRVWQGKDATPVVLASEGQPNPQFGSGLRYITSRIANYANDAILRHPAVGMLYFEADTILPLRMNPVPAFELHAVHFEFYGHARRLKMYRPERHPMEWERFEHLMGGPVERTPE